MKIDFQFQTEYGLFSDALYFEDDILPSEDVIEAMKQERLKNWISFVTTPTEYGSDTQPIEE